MVVALLAVKSMPLVALLTTLPVTTLFELAPAALAAAAAVTLALVWGRPAMPMVAALVFSSPTKQLRMVLFWQPLVVVGRNSA